MTGKCERRNRAYKEINSEYEKSDRYGIKKRWYRRRDKRQESIWANKT